MNDKYKLRCGEILTQHSRGEIDTATAFMLLRFRGMDSETAAFRLRWNEHVKRIVDRGIVTLKGAE